MWKITTALTLPASAGVPLMAIWNIQNSLFTGYSLLLPFAKI
jgi:hypothetical protein